MPAIQPFIIEPIWEQFAALLSEPYPQAPGRAPSDRGDLREVNAFAASGYEPLGGGAYELLLSKRSQEVGVVYREAKEADRLLGLLLERDHHRG